MGPMFFCDECSQLLAHYEGEEWIDPLEDCQWECTACPAIYYCCQRQNELTLEWRHEPVTDIAPAPAPTPDETPQRARE